MMMSTSVAKSCPTFLPFSDRKLRQKLKGKVKALKQVTVLGVFSLYRLVFVPDFLKIYGCKLRLHCLNLHTVFVVFFEGEFVKN